MDGPIQQHNTLCSSKPLAKYFFLNLFVMMQLNWKLKAISFIFHSQQETYFFFFSSPIHLLIHVVYYKSHLHPYPYTFMVNSPCTRCCSGLTRQTQQTWPTRRPPRSSRPWRSPTRYRIRCPRGGRPRRLWSPRGGY